MSDFIEEVYAPLLLKNGFTPDPNNKKYNPMGTCWKLSPEIGEGYYWTYGKHDLYDIRIHDFSYHRDMLMDFELPESLSIAYYESISGEEISPYRRLKAGCVKAFHGGTPYRVMIHKKIPVRSINIEIMPAYYNKYLQTLYTKGSVYPEKIFGEIDQTFEFREMVQLLMKVKNYAGTGIAAKLFYESKVAEAVSLIVEWSNHRKKRGVDSISARDNKQMKNVTAYIDDHYTLELSLEQIAKIACMSQTKLKYTFKRYHECTITEYIQQRRMGQAEHLLANSDLPIGQVAKVVGYTSPSRFSELFRLSTGIQPRIYREISQKQTG